MHLFKRFYHFSTNGNRINFSLFSSWQVNVTMPGRTTSAKQIASAFPGHSLQNCRGRKRMWVKFFISISKNFILIWGQNLGSIYFQYEVISRRKVLSFSHKQAEEGSEKNPTEGSTRTTFGIVQFQYKFLQDINMTELWGWDTQAGRQDGLSGVLCNANNRIFSQLQTLRKHFGHTSPVAKKVRMQSCYWEEDKRCSKAKIWLSRWFTLP